MGMFSGCATVKGPTSARKPIGQHIVRERHDLVSRGVNIAMHVANEVANPGSLGEIAWMYHEHVLVGGSDDVGRFGVVVKKLTRMKDRAGR